MCKLSQKVIWELDPRLIYNLSNNIQNRFWSEILKLWAQYKVNDDEYIDTRTYPIWGSYFLNNENLLFYKDILKQKGLNQVNDLLADNGMVYGYTDFKEFF